jgi:hypothetical protein
MIDNCMDMGANCGKKVLLYAWVYISFQYIRGELLLLLLRVTINNNPTTINFYTAGIFFNLNIMVEFARHTHIIPLDNFLIVKRNARLRRK